MPYMTGRNGAERSGAEFAVSRLIIDGLCGKPVSREEAGG
jgi:hypothetical protein